MFCELIEFLCPYISFIFISLIFFQVENILLSESHHYVLCDFGSSTARVLDPSQINVSQIEEEIQK